MTLLLVREALRRARLTPEDASLPEIRMRETTRNISRVKVNTGLGSAAEHACELSFTSRLCL